MKNKLSNQPIKSICQQDIQSLQETFDQLISWQEPLNLMNTFFSDESRPVNKQQVAKKYYAYSKVSNAFHSDFEQLIIKMNQQLTELKIREKL